MGPKTADEVMTAIPLAKVLGDDGHGVGYRFNQDNVMLVESPEDVVKAGHIPHIPIMLGTTHNEMRRYIVGMDVKSVDDLRLRLAKDWPDYARQLFEAYPIVDNLDDQLAVLYSDWGMTCRTDVDLDEYVSRCRARRTRRLRDWLG